MTLTNVWMMSDLDVLLPYHPPEVSDGGAEGPLRGNVIVAGYPLQDKQWC